MTEIIGAVRQYAQAPRNVSKSFYFYTVILMSRFSKSGANCYTANCYKHCQPAVRAIIITLHIIIIIYIYSYVGT